MMQTGRPYKLRNPQAVAWFIVLSGFVIFCGLCVTVTATVRWFLFDFQVDLNANVLVSRGRVEVRMVDGTNTSINRSQEIGANAFLSTETGSQGYIAFEDTNSGEIVASVFILQESAITLGRASQPLFSWSSNPYTITLNNPSGRFHVEIPKRTSRPLSLTIVTPAGEAQFSGAGKFRLDVASGQTTLTALYGEATLFSSTGGAQIASVGLVVVSQGEGPTTQVFTPQPISEDVLNAGFGSADDLAVNPALPVGWACASQANRQVEPQGNIGRELFEHRVSLRMLRQGEGLDHAESSCTYTLGLTPGIPLDVMGYTSLSVRARIKIRFQDVTTCGIRGSECPVMLELEYLGKGNTPDQPQFWRHGFYALRPAADNNPLSCDTCVQDHEKLSPDVWYLYDSGDLFRLLPENRRPEKILRLKVYASGHAYDAVVTDLVLAAGK